MEKTMIKRADGKIEPPTFPCPGCIATGPAECIGLTCVHYTPGPVEERIETAGDLLTQAGNRLKLHANQEITVFEDGFFVPSLGTIRACLDCGVLVAGGTTRCGFCAEKDKR